MKKPRTAIVPFSEIAKNGGRLDPAYYLGLNEDRDYEKAKITFGHACGRLYKVCKALISARWRVFRWRIEGRIKYK